MGLISYKRPGFRRSDYGKIADLAWLLIVFLRKRLDRSMSKMFRHHPDIIIYNGTCYSIANEKKLLEHIKKQKADFYILGHLNSEKIKQIPEKEAMIVNEAYQRCRKVFFFSERTKAVAERQLRNVIPNARIIRNPVNMKETTVIEFPGIKAAVNFAVPANLVIAHKGQDVLLTILSLPHWKERNFHLNLYGSGPDKALLENLTRSLELTEKVSFHGTVNDIREVWKKNHLLLLPSLMEGMPLALVEAMLCGRPSVVTDVGGVSEWIEEGISGFIAEEATTVSFDKALEKAWTAREQWEQLGLNAHRRASYLYDPQAGKTLLQEILN
jgi:glycosyltransferase involved in cell wall biosynthesis